MQVISWLDERVFEVRGLLSPGECAEQIGRAEAIGFDAATIERADGAVRREDVRNNDRVILDDPDLAAMLFARTRACLPASLGSSKLLQGLNERLRYYRYDPGQSFDWHRDGAFRSPAGAVSELTFMVYLNEGYEGGGTSFEPGRSPVPFDPFTVIPRTGSALIFEHHLLHRGDAVTAGRKYALRTDVLYGAGA